MILTKKHLFLLFGIITVIVGAGIIYNNFVSPKLAMTFVSVPGEIDTVVIDAGHGGFDGGAVGVGNVLEKEINLAIARRLNRLMRLCGYKTVMTRTSDCALTDSESGAVNAVSMKKTDMHKRLKIMDGTANSITVSIHQNKFGQPKYHGAQMFYGVKNPLSETLAQSLQSRFASQLQPDNKREIKKAQKDLFLLYYTQAPAVIAECGFISNPDECANLCDEEYQCKTAFAVCCGITDFIKG